MAPATATDDPIVAIYPVPGKLDEGTEKSAPLAPMPVRLERAEAEKVVKRGAFSYVDPTFEERKAAADAARPAAVAAASPSAAAVRAAEKAAEKAEAESVAKDAEIEALKTKLAEAEAAAKKG
jgi:hypothetical protein